MKKKIISLFILTLMIMAIIGCGAQTDKSTLSEIKEKKKFTYALTGACLLYTSNKYQPTFSRFLALILK